MSCAYSIACCLDNRLTPSNSMALALVASFTEPVQSGSYFLSRTFRPGGTDNRFISFRTSFIALSFFAGMISVLVGIALP